MTSEEMRAAIAKHPHWYHQITLAPGIVTPGINDSAHILSLIDLPAEMRGLRVLDIGTRDGYFAFECERRGADVTAVDYLPAAATGFAIAASILGSRVSYFQDNIFRLRPDKFGTFDLVLMLGLLYHLRDPLGALDIVRDLCSGRLILETHVCDDYFMLPDGSIAPLATVDERLVRTPIMQFCPGDSLNADPSNYWAPNTVCVEALLREAAFEVTGVTRVGNRSVLEACVSNDPGTLYQRSIARGDVFPTSG